MTWFKVDDGFAVHPKAVAAGNAAIGLWVRAGAWCAQQLTDGVVPRHMLGVLGAKPKEAASLVAVGLWGVTADGWCFHDWETYQPSRERVEAERHAATERQRRAREAAVSRRDTGVTHAEVQAQSRSPMTRSPRPDPTRPELPDGSSTSSSPTAAPRDDVEALCDHLATRIEANGTPRPDISKAWLTSARLLLDSDGIDPEKAHRLIDWCQDDSFWKSNIMSMPTFRTKYHQLRLKALEQHTNGQRPGRPTPTESVSAIAAIGARLQAQEDAKKACTTRGIGA